MQIGCRLLQGEQFFGNRRREQDAFRKGSKFHGSANYQKSETQANQRVINEETPDDFAVARGLSGGGTIMICQQAINGPLRLADLWFGNERDR